LPRVIWSHNTTTSRATGFSPFRLLYGTEAMTPEEIKNGSLRATKKSENPKEIAKVEKDLIELDILEAAQNLEKYQQETRKWKDKKIVRKEIKVCDLVIKRKKDWENPRKLQETWEGPYIVKESNRSGSFRLTDELGMELPHSWNVESLKRYYP
jgi:hypothetical protein